MGKIEDKIIQSFSEVDITELKVLIIAIYNRPLDFPEQYVARIFDGDKPTNVILLDSSLSHIRQEIKFNFPKMVRLPKSKKDIETLVETWI